MPAPIPPGAFPGAGVLLLAIAALVTRAPAIVLLSLASVGAWLVVEITGRLSLTGVEVSLELRPLRIVAGEALELAVTVVNRKPLPMPWLDIRVALPEAVEPYGAIPGVPRGSVGAGFAPRGHERTVLRFPLRATQRGAYVLGPVRLRSGDWLGFTHQERVFDLTPQVVVHPAPVRVLDRHLPALRPLAETAVRRGLLPDPLRFRGVRGHRPGDPRKEIHWKASARLRELQTKLYEPATSLDAIFLVNVASYEQFWIQADPDASELVISSAAQLMRAAAEAGRQVGLITNGIDNLTHERPRSALGRGPRPLQRALEILARLGPYAAAAPESVFLRERGRLPWGATLVVITPRLGPGLAGACVALRRAHHRILALSVARIETELATQLRGAGIVVSDLDAAPLADAS